MFWCSTKQGVCLGLLRWKSLAGCPKISPTFPLLQTRTCLCASTPKETNKPLKHWTLVVHPFSKVRVRLGCNISIRPLDPLVFPESNRAFITVHGTSADQGVKLDNVHVHYDDQSKELFILSEKVNSNVSVEVSAPVKSDLDITAQGEGNVHVQKMECEECKVQTETGSCVLHSVKAHSIQLQSQGGAITGVGTIHGNVDISASGDSAVDIKKVQGTIMKVSTEHGPLKIKAIYAESISMASTSGSIQLGHVHGDCTVKTETGNVTVDGSNGHLRVWSYSGDIDAYVGETGSAELTSQEGSVCVRVPSSISAGLQLCGASVEVSPEVILQDAERHSDHSQTTVTGHMNTHPQGGRWIKAQAARGPVRLKTQSWFESLKLGS